MGKSQERIKERKKEGRGMKKKKRIKKTMEIGHNRQSEKKCSHHMYTTPRYCVRSDHSKLISEQKA